MAGLKLMAVAFLASLLSTQAAPSSKFLLQQADDWRQDPRWPDCCQYSSVLRAFLCSDCDPALTEVPGDIPADTVLIDLSFNSVSFLNADVFSKHGTTLAFLILSGNTIGLIADDVFVGLDGLGELNMEDNQITAVPNYLPSSLTTLSLQGNPLSEVNSGTLAGLSSLTTLTLSATRIGTDTFAGLSLTSLNVSTCHIERNAFRGLAPTIDLVLDDPCKSYLSAENRLTVESLAFAGIGGDTEDSVNIVIRNTTITDLPYRAFYTLGASVKGIHLTQIDGLTAIQPGAFSDNTALQEIIIEGQDGDNILTLYSGIFAGFMPNLRKVDLSNLGVVHSIHGGIFDDFDSLQEVYLDGLDFTYIPPNVLLPLEAFTMSDLNVGNNPYHCDCNLRWLKEMLDRAEFNWFPATTTCASPFLLAGIRFDVLDASDFVC